MLKKLTLNSILFVPLCLHAETAGDYLDRGKQSYIFGDTKQATAEVLEGLRRFPTDPALRQIMTYFREEKRNPEQQKGKSQDGQDKDQKQDQQSSGSEQKQDGQPKEEQSKDGEEKQREKKSGEKKDDQGAEKKNGQSEPQPAPEPGTKKKEGEVKAAPQYDKAENDAKDQAETDARAAAEGKMTEQQAKALLESLKGEDDRVQLRDRNERRAVGRVFRDW